MSKLEIELSRDGDQYSALVGPNIQEGFFGHGDTPNEAIRNLVDEANGSGIDLYNYT